MKKVWVEALTPKQILLFSYLQQELPNIDFYLTSRDYDLNRELAKELWRKVYIVGKHGGATPYSKVRETIRREEKLLTIAREEEPDLHLTFASPDSTRVAFGLQLPVVSCNDTPHSTIVSRLVIPLSSDFIAPQPVAPFFQHYEEFTRIHVFRGVFEYAWVSRFKPSEDILRDYSVEPFNYVFIRPGEQKAYYYRDAIAATILPLKIARHLLRRSSLKLLIYPRYKEQYILYKRELKDTGGRVTFIEKPGVFLNLEYFARLVVTGGGTIATESALLGVPSLTTFPRELEVHTYLREKGFPVYRYTGLHIIERLLSTKEDIYDREVFLQKARKMFEDPVARIAEVIKMHLETDASSLYSRNKKFL
jgi:predicted glycosyltransferase